MRTRQKRVATDPWRSLGCRTTPLEHWSKRKPTVEPRWAKQQTKKLRPKPTKVSSKPLLDRVTGLLIGGIVGEICCAAPACADDMTFTSDDKEELQVLIDEGGDYCGMERYLLQPVKSVVMPVPGKARKTTDSGDFTWTINGDLMPVVKEATHMAIKRSAISNEHAIEEH